MIGVPRSEYCLLHDCIVELFRCVKQFGLIATGYEKYGSQSELEKDAIKHLLDIYVKVNKEADEDPSVKEEAAKWFKRMEDGDEDALKNWRVWREMSVKRYEEEYERLNVKFDVYTGESMVGKENMERALEKLDEMGLISDVNGAKLVDLEKWKLGKAVLKKKGKEIYLFSFSFFSSPLFFPFRWNFHLPYP